MLAAALRRRIGLFDATMLVLGSMVGVGIFIVPGIVAQYVRSPAAFLGVWMFGGLIAICGALSNGELGAAFPRGGGEYVYLRQTYGPLAGFLSGWTSFWIGFPGSVATHAAAFARIVGPSLGLPELPIALATVLALTMLNARGIDPGRWTQNVLVGTVVALFAAFVVAGLLTGARASAPPLPGGERASDLALACVPVLFAYAGWNAATYVAGEIRDPRRTLARALLLGTVACTALYLVINVILLRIAPIPVLREQTDIASFAAERTFGAGGAVITKALVALAVLGSLQASIVTGPRIYQAMAEDGILFRRLAEVHPKRRVPVNAIVAQGAIAAALLLTGTFERLLTFTTVAIVAFSTLTVLGVLVLRARRPTLPRPFRVPLWVPIVFVVANGWVLVRLLASGVREAIVGLSIVAAGVPAYLLFRRRSPLRA
ncbi:MAG: amino acid permease [Deltaproteobacteria bacterium]|nr:amino acid permease [Deltaproteobacteria bacterium]